MEVKRLLEFLKYDPIEGTVSYIKSGKSLVPDSDGLVIVIDPISKKKKKFKLEKLCYSMLFGVNLTKDDKIIHKNLDETDFTARNLVMVTPMQYKELKEAWKNIQGGIKLQPHPRESFTYELSWYEKGVKRSQVVYDFIVAKQLERKLLFRFSKLLTKYCSSN